MQKNVNKISKILELIIKITKGLIDFIAIFKKNPEKERNKIIEKAADVIAEFEGFKPKVYKCSAGVDTIGYGTTEFLKTLSRKEKDELVITKEEARKYLINHITLDLIFLEKSLKERGVNIIPPLKIALLSWMYNLSRHRITPSNSTLCKIILNRECNAKDVEEQFLRWNKETINGELVASKGLTRRRKKECELFKNYKEIYIM
jgi:lysozyme